VPLARRQALCVGIMSYNDQVNIGLVGDYDAMADLDSFALDLEATTQEVIKTAPKAAAKTGTKKKATKKKAKAAASRNGSGPVAAESRS
jgi:WS/DGAT C-terminal domain